MMSINRAARENPTRIRRWRKLADACRSATTSRTSGPTDTPMLATRSEKLREAFLKAIPFRRFAKPEEIADAVVYFASPQSAYVTGQVMSVSGGLTFAG